MVREIMQESFIQKIKRFNYKKYKFVFVSGFLLLLLPITFLSVQRQQDIRQRASEIVPTPTPSYGSTPIEDIDKYPKQPNGVQTLAWFGNTAVADFDKYKSYIAKQMNHYHFGHCAMAQIRQDQTNFINALNYLKTNNPAMTIGSSIYGLATFTPCHPLYYVLTDEDYLHKLDGSVIVPSNPNTRIINFSSASARQKIVDYVRDTILANPNISSIFIDNYFPQREYKNAIYADGCKEGPCNTFEFWHNNVTALSQELKSILPENKKIAYNGFRKNMAIEHEAVTGPLNESYLNFHSGVLTEHTHEIYNDPTFFKNLLEAVQSATAQGKTVYFHVLPRLLFNQQSSELINLDMQRFFLGSYLLIQNNPYTYFGYAPGNLYNMNEGVFFYKDWNMDYGLPTGQYREENGLYIRNYEKGMVVVNPTTSPISYALPAGDFRMWDPYYTDIVKGAQTIPAKNGIFFFKPVCVEMPPPQNIQPSGSIVPGLQSLSWDKVPGAVRYLLRIDDRTNTSEPAGACQGRTGDVCLGLTETTYNYNFLDGHKYNWWVHAVNYCGTYGQPKNTTITVSSTPTSTVSPTPTIAINSPTPTATIPSPTATRIPTPTPTRTPTPTPFVDTTAPTVTITSPASGVTLSYGGTITFSASATDNVGVNRVQFYRNGSLIATDTSSPFSVTSTIPVPSSQIRTKSITLSVTAYDASGNKTSFSRSYSIR